MLNASLCLYRSAHDNSLTTYEVQYRGVDSPNDVDEIFYRAVTVSAGMELSYNLSGLMDHSAYNVSVRATNQYGVGDFSEEVTVRTEEGGECVLHCTMQRAAVYTDDNACTAKTAYTHLMLPSDLQDTDKLTHSHTHTHKPTTAFMHYVGILLMMLPYPNVPVTVSS